MNGNGKPVRGSLTMSAPTPEPDIESDYPEFVELPPPDDSVYSDIAISAFPDSGFDMELYLDTLRNAFVKEAMKRSVGNKTIAAQLLRLDYSRFKAYLRRAEVEDDKR